MDHELSRHNISTNTSILPQVGTFSTDTPGTEGEQEGDTTEEMAKEFGTEFTLRQARLNEELQVFMLIFMWERKSECIYLVIAMTIFCFSIFCHNVCTH